MSNKLVGMAMTLVTEQTEQKDALMPLHCQYQLVTEKKQIQFEFSKAEVTETTREDRREVTITETGIKGTDIPTKNDIYGAKFENTILYLNHQTKEDIKVIDVTMRFEDGHIVIIPKELLKTLQDTIIIM